MSSTHSGPPPDPWAVQEAKATLSPFRLITLVLQRRGVILGVPILAAAVAVLFVLFFGKHTATARFVPQISDGGLASLSGLAAQFGVPIPTGATAESPDFYVTLLTSGEVLSQVVTSHFTVAAQPESPDSLYGSLLDHLDITGDTPAERLRDGVDALEQKVGASASVRSGIITLAVSTKNPHLSEAVARRILDVTSDFDRSRRQRQAQTERAFLEDRMASSAAELGAAEESLMRFMDQNRRPQQSALLSMELDRLQREVTLRQQVHTTLAQGYEQTRMEEARNTPSLTVVDRPEGSSRPKTTPLVAAVMGWAFGLAATVAALLSREYLNRHAGSQDFLELKRALGRKGRRSGEASAKYPTEELVP